MVAQNYPCNLTTLNWECPNIYATFGFKVLLMFYFCTEVYLKRFVIHYHRIYCGKTV